MGAALLSGNLNQNLKDPEANPYGLVRGKNEGANSDAGKQALIAGIVIATTLLAGKIAKGLKWLVSTIGRSLSRASGAVSTAVNRLFGRPNMAKKADVRQIESAQEIKSSFPGK